MAQIRYIAVHNSGGLEGQPLARTQNQVFQQIENAHKARFNFKSDLGFWSGYNILIQGNGEHFQARYLGEETAANKGHNFDTISIWLAGNFMKGVEVPTIEQKMKLKNILESMLRGDFGKFGLKVASGTTFDLSKDRVLPHRLLQSSTSCYGDSLPDNWAKDLISSPSLEETNKKNLSQLLITLQQLYNNLLQLYQRKLLGKKLVPCGECDVIG